MKQVSRISDSPWSRLSAAVLDYFLAPTNSYLTDGRSEARWKLSLLNDKGLEELLLDRQAEQDFSWSPVVLIIANVKMDSGLGRLGDDRVFYLFRPERLEDVPTMAARFLQAYGHPVTALCSGLSQVSSSRDLWNVSGSDDSRFWHDLVDVYVSLKRMTFSYDMSLIIHEEQEFLGAKKSAHLRRLFQPSSMG